MATYVPLLFWIISAVICYYLAKARHVKPNLMWRLIVVFLGPFAIPLIFFAKQEISVEAR